MMHTRQDRCNSLFRSCFGFKLGCEIDFIRWSIIDFICKRRRQTTTWMRVFWSSVRCGVVVVVLYTLLHSCSIMKWNLKLTSCWLNFPQILLLRYLASITLLWWGSFTSCEHLTGPAAVNGIPVDEPQDILLITTFPQKKPVPMNMRLQTFLSLNAWLLRSVGANSDVIRFMLVRLKLCSRTRSQGYNLIQLQ